MTDDLRDPDRAVDFIIENAESFADAKGERVHIENFLRSKKALLMNKSEAKTVADREAYAYAHPEYIQLVDGLRAAVAVEERIKWLLIAAQARVEIWRTRSANNREPIPAPAKDLRHVPERVHAAQFLCDGLLPTLRNKEAGG